MMPNPQSLNTIGSPDKPNTLSSSDPIYPESPQLISETSAAIEQTLRPKQLSFERHDLDELLQNNYDAAHLVQLFKNDFPDAYNCKLGLGSGNFTIGDHTQKVLQQFDRYLSKEDLPFGLDINFFRVILVLHDIGKDEAIKAGDAAKQHEFNPVMTEKILQELNFTPEQIALAKALTGSDPLGTLFKSKDAERGATIAFNKIKQLATTLQVKVEDLYQLFLVFYKADASSYTTKAGFRNFLDDLFEFDDQLGLVDLSTKAQDRVDYLEEKIYQ